MGDCGELLSPDDLPGWRGAMLRAATEEDYVAELKVGGLDRAARFTWARAARETMVVYRHALA
jgi:hypothetical protein